MSDATPVSGSNSTRPSCAADRFADLWRQAPRPDLEAFVATAGNLSSSELSEVLRIDLRELWELGERALAERYLARFPQVNDDASAAVDLVFAEFLVRERLGERLHADEYRLRFPALADELEAQIGFHSAAAPPSNESLASTISPAETWNHAQHGDELAGRFGRYQIVRPLGRGGMGAVYLAHDTVLHRPVALKIPRFDRSLGADVIERFYREARIAAQFNHPNLCPVYDVGQVGEVHYLAMAHLAGETLAARLARVGTLPVQTAVALALQLAQAMAVAHRAGVLHRDLKPSNVMLDEAGAPIVMDFGLARSEHSEESLLSSTGAFVGTPAYSAPEQLAGEKLRIGPAADVYSLGVIFYEMLAGRPPFVGTVATVMKQAIVDRPPDLQQFRPEASPKLAEICRRTLAKDPAERWPSMESLAAELAAVSTASREPTTSQVSSSPALRSKQRRRWTSLLVAGGIGLVGCVALLGAITYWQTPGDLPAPRHVVAPGPRDDTLFQPGSRWLGDFHFLPPFSDYEGDLELRVLERNGASFRGQYMTEGQFEWLIAGSIKNGELEWKYVEVVRGAPAADLVNEGSGVGVVRGDAIEGEFRRSSRAHDDRARLRMRLVGPKPGSP